MVLGSVWPDGCLFLPCVFLFIPECRGNVLNIARFALNIELSADVGINRGAQSFLDLSLDITVISSLGGLAK